MPKHPTRRTYRATAKAERRENLAREPIAFARTLDSHRIDANPNRAKNGAAVLNYSERSLARIDSIANLRETSEGYRDA